MWQWWTRLKYVWYFCNGVRENCSHLFTKSGSIWKKTNLSILVDNKSIYISSLHTIKIVTMILFIADNSSTTRNSKNGNHVVKIVTITIGICVGLITLLILLYVKRKKMRQLKRSITYRTGNIDFTSRLYFWFANDRSLV